MGRRERERQRDDVDACVKQKLNRKGSLGGLSSLMLTSERHGKTGNFKNPETSSGNTV